MKLFFQINLYRVFTIICLYPNLLLCNELNKAKALIDAINIKYNQGHSYSYEVKSYYKSSQKVDKIKFNTKVFVSKNAGNKLPKRFFVLDENESLIYWFENDILSFVDTATKTIQCEELKLPYNKLKRGKLNWSIYSPFILNNLLIDTSKWNSTTCEMHLINDIKEIKIILIKTFKNSDNAIPGSPKIGDISLIIKLNPMDTLITEIEEILRVAPHPQITCWEFNNYTSNFDLYDTKLKNKKDNLIDFRIVSTQQKSEVRKYSYFIGSEFPDTVTLYSAMNEKLSLLDINTNYILIDFWFRGCYPCIIASKALNNLSTKYRKNDQLKIIGINIFDTAYHLIAPYIEKQKINYDQYFTINKCFATQYFSGYGFPVLMIYDTRKRNIIYFSEGADENTESELENFISLNIFKK